MESSGRKPDVSRRAGTPTSARRALYRCGCGYHSGARRSGLLMSSGQACCLFATTIASWAKSRNLRRGIALRDSCLGACASEPEEVADDEICPRCGAARRRFCPTRRDCSAAPLALSERARGAANATTPENPNPHLASRPAIATQAASPDGVVSQSRCRPSRCTSTRPAPTSFFSE